MKQSTTFLLLAIPLFILAQSSPNRKIPKNIELPFDTISNKVTYTRVVEVPGKDTESLMDIVHDWIVLKFNNSEKSNLYLTDNKISGKGYFKFEFHKALFSNLYAEVYSNYRFDFKDEKFRVVFTEFIVDEVWNNIQSNKTAYPQNLSIEDWQNPKGMIMKSIDDKLLYSFDIQLTSYIESLEEDIKISATINDSW